MHDEIDIHLTAADIAGADGIDAPRQKIVARRPDDRAGGREVRPDRSARLIGNEQQANMHAAGDKPFNTAFDGHHETAHMRRQIIGAGNLADEEIG